MAPPRPIPWRALGFAVLALLFLMQGYSCLAGLDFRDYDDLARHALARFWAQRPYFIWGDGYWPTLPAIARGAALRLFAPWAAPHPALMLFLTRLVTVGYLWGCWRLLAGITARLGGGRTAVLLATSFFLLNACTFHFVASAYAEPDGLFYFLAALAITLRCVEERDFRASRILLIGLALAPACLTRYEAWTLPFVFAGALLWSARRELRPWRRWAGLCLPALPIAAWLAAQAALFGEPFHFLKVGGAYSHFGLSLHHPRSTLIQTARTLLSIHPLWLPLAGLAGLGELLRRRREPLILAYGAFVILFGWWTVYRFWGHQMSIRFALEPALLIAAPGAIALERLARPRRLGRALLIALTVLNLAAFGVMLKRTQPYVQPSLRAFCQAVQRQTGDGLILVCDHEGPAQEHPLQVFRLLVTTERLIIDQWLGDPQTFTPALLRQRRIGYILARQPRPALIAGPPALALAGSDWKLWRVAP